MKKESTALDSVSDLSRLSKSRLHRVAADVGQLRSVSDAQTQHLITELQTCQIELERQNEELRQSHRNLEESRNKYSDLYDCAPVGYLTLSASGNIIEINLTGAIILAADPQTLIAEPLSRFIAFSHQDSYEKHCRRCLDTNTRQTCKLNMQKLDGTPFVARLESIAVSDDSSRLQRLRTILIDITEPVLAARALREAEAKYRLVVDHAAEGICLAQDGRLQFVNPAVIAFTGYSEQQLVTRPFEEFIHLKDRPMVSSRQLQTLAGGCASRRYAFRIVDTCGRITWVENTSVRVPWNGRPATLNFLTDITDRKQAEDNLRESEAQKRAILDASLDLIRYVDKDLRLLWINKALTDLVQMPPEDLVGKFCYQIGPGRNTPCEGCPTIKSGQTGQIERAVMYHNCIYGIQGASYWDVYTVPIKNSADEIEGFIQVSRDVTAEKKTEAKLKISNRQLMEESSRRKLLSRRLIELLENERRQIAGELHDQMGQALTTIRMGFESIHEQLDTVGSPVQELVKSVEDMAVQNLIKLKNIAYELRPTILDNLGLVPSVRALIQDIQKTTGLRIHFFSQEIPEHMDPDKSLTLYRIVQEALNNIIRHAGATRVFVNLVFKDNSILLSVEDNGVGFDPGRILPNATGKGLLGILIMQERVIQVDGELRIESQIGKGTHILVEIPL